MATKEYGGRISRSVSQMEKDEQNGANPEVIGAYIAKNRREEVQADLCGRSAVQVP